MSYQPKGLYNEFNTFFPWFKIMFYTKKNVYFTLISLSISNSNYLKVFKI